VTITLRETEGNVEEQSLLADGGTMTRYEDDVSKHDI
jgi:hypothetical protein